MTTFTISTDFQLTIPFIYTKLLFYQCSLFTITFYIQSTNENSYNHPTDENYNNLCIQSTNERTLIINPPMRTLTIHQMRTFTISTDFPLTIPFIYTKLLFYQCSLFTITFYIQSTNENSYNHPPDENFNNLCIQSTNERTLIINPLMRTLTIHQMRTLTIFPYNPLMRTLTIHQMRTLTIFAYNPPDENFNNLCIQSTDENFNNPPDENSYNLCIQSTDENSYN